MKSDSFTLPYMWRSIIVTHGRLTSPLALTPAAARDRVVRIPAVLAIVMTLLVAVTVALFSAATPAQAATITEQTGFGSNPGNLQMFRYVPAGLPAGRPLVVAMHGCTQNASGYGASTGWTALADAWGFAVVLPQQKSANNANACFNWFETGDTTRDSGEALSIKQMVDRMKSDFGSDAARTYVTGLSGGGAMTAVMLATYPDVFAGGGIVAGLPYRCATTVAAAFGCMSPGVDLSPAQWGAKVRAASTYSGPWPKVSIWHGSADTTVRPMNLTESVEQWTNVHGISQTPTASDTVAGFAHKVYGSQVETYELAGMNHGQPIDPGTGPAQCGAAAPYILDVNICSAYYLATFWGLTGPTQPPTSTPPVTVSPTPTATPTSTAPAACFTASNYAHTVAGRAHQTGGYTYANGSNQAMGLWNVFLTHTLKESPSGYFVIADAGCP